MPVIIQNHIPVAHQGQVTPKRPAMARHIVPALALPVLLILIVYIAYSTVVAQRSMPVLRHQMARTPTNYGLQYTEVSFLSAVDHIPLKGWFIDSTGTQTILLLHGSDDAKDSIALLELSQTLVKHNYDVLLIDMRGHGESGGDQFAMGQWSDRDIDGALEYLRGRGVTQIGVIGHSLGGVVALWSAPDRPTLRAIVADSAFADPSSAVKTEMTHIGSLSTLFVPGVYMMGSLLYGTDWANYLPERAMTRLNDRPVLLIHGAADNTIPVENAYRLQKAGANNPNLQVWITPTSDHLRSYFDHPQEYRERVLAFFDRYLH